MSTAVVASGASSCGGAVSDAYVIEGQPGTVEPIKGTDLARVTLTRRAARRLQIETAPTLRSGRAVVVPERAVFVDDDGVWWVYTSPRSNTFVRHRIVIDRQRHGRTVLSEGPRPGTDVVTVGVAELYGLEEGIAH